MLRKTGGYALALGLLFTQQAAAETYEVALMGAGFFPTITYVQPGDIINFHNLGAGVAIIGASDESWSTGQMEPFSSYTLVITSGMTASFEDFHARAQYTDEDILANQAAIDEALYINETTDSFVEVPSPLFAAGEFAIDVPAPIISLGDGIPVSEVGGL